MSDLFTRMFLVLCLLVSCFLLTCGTLNSGYVCDNDCRERNYFYNADATDPTDYWLQEVECRFCTGYRCADVNPSQGSTAACKPTDKDQFLKVCDNYAICAV